MDDLFFWGTFLARHLVGKRHELFPAVWERAKVETWRLAVYTVFYGKTMPRVDSQTYHTIDAVLESMEGAETGDLASLESLVILFRANDDTTPREWNELVTRFVLPMLGEVYKPRKRTAKKAPATVEAVVA